MVPWAHPSSQPKQHLDQFSRFCTAHVSVVQHVRTCPSPSKSLLPMNKSGVPSNMWFPGSIRFSIPNYTSISSAIFAQLMADSPIHMIAYFITVILHPYKLQDRCSQQAKNFIISILDQSSCLHHLLLAAT